MNSMRMMCCAAAIAFATAPAFAEPPPATAKKASLDEFKAFADGKTVKVEILDMDVPVTATLVWSWAEMSIAGEALIDNKDTVEVRNELVLDGEKACSKGDGEPTCHFIYIDGDKFYEVRDDGEVHAVSTLQN